MDMKRIIERAGNLPAAAIATRLNEALAANDAVVVTAEPGAGKSTLLPLTMLESVTDDGRILMLEPRRLAARQIAMRMADILGESVGASVGYRVRFEKKVSDATRIEVLTEGILTRMLVNDPTLDGVSTIIFDEFHERSINSDLALALVREAQRVIRPDLRIVIMSATIDAASICTSLNAPLISCEGRMFPVEVVNAPEEKDIRDIAETTASAIRKAHGKHEGDILAFLPGQASIVRCASLLEGSVGATAIHPLYGNLPPEMQRRAIAPSAAGERKIVLATPIAETSLTIEGVRIVIDSGLCRKLIHDHNTGLSRLETVRISLDMAKQRAGRAGRVAPGICYRLWTKGTEHNMDQQRMPELLEADLAPTVLDIAAFGESNIQSLPWLTLPPAANIARAKNLLIALGALDSKGAITTTGRSMSSLPCHPRISRMMMKASTDAEKALACDIAAILEEKDPMNTESDSELSLRIAMLRRARTTSLGRWSEIARIAKEYRLLLGCDEDNSVISPYEAGALVAFAYPERIALANGNSGTYRLSGGETVRIDRNDSISGYDWLAIASLHTDGTSGRVFLASPVNISDIAELITTRDNISWDSRQECIVMQREKRIGKLITDSKPIHDASREAICSIICDAVEKDGISLLNWDDASTALQRRIAQVAQWHPELEVPDVSTSKILTTTHQWLPLYIESEGHLRTNAADLRRIDMSSVIWGMIPYDLQLGIDRLAPSHIEVPTGSRIRIDYRSAAEAPVLSVRLQECFGMKETPRINGGSQPLLMELLSPGFKPVQLTQDLGSFWRTTYFEVRKELKRRYPKHHWPDNPLEAEAVRGVRRRDASANT